MEVRFVVTDTAQIRAIYSCADSDSSARRTNEQRMQVEGMGEIHIVLYPELAPKSVERFVGLAQQGFYDRTLFHRVISGFMVQAGDPNTRDDDPKNDGKGGSGQRLEDEFHGAPHLRGTVAMANRGRPNTGSSQFFIVQRDHRELDRRYAVIGRVIRGMEVVDRIASTKTDAHGRWGPMNRPLRDVVLARASIAGAESANSARSGEPATSPES